jgi:hypothetical protein
VARQGVCDLPSLRLERWSDEETAASDAVRRLHVLRIARPANGALDGDGGSFTAVMHSATAKLILGDIFGLAFFQMPLK